MTKFETGVVYLRYLDNGGVCAYKIPKRTEKTATISIHPGGKYEKIKRVRITKCGCCEYMQLADTVIAFSDDDIREEN